MRKILKSLGLALLILAFKPAFASETPKKRFQ